ncbi:ParA family protein [Vibrio parahaemolyticus]
MAKGKVVTVMNMKGGVGKTTVTTNLATIIAGTGVSANHKQILVIDYDPQFNLSQALLKRQDYETAQAQKRNILSVLVDPTSELDLCQLQRPESAEPPRLQDLTFNVFQESGRRLDIITSTLDLMPLAISSSEKAQDIMAKRFYKMIDQARARYNLIIIDCHPAGSLFTKTSIRASDHILIPVSPHNYASRGIALMNDFTKTLFSGTQKPKLHIVYNCIGPQDAAFLEKMEKVTSFKKISLTNHVQKLSAFQATMEGKDYLFNTKKPHSTRAYNNMVNVAKELLGKLSN